MIIPAIDLIGGKVVRLFKGNYAEKTEYEFSPWSATAPIRQTERSSFTLLTSTAPRIPLRGSLLL